MTALVELTAEQLAALVEQPVNRILATAKRDGLDLRFESISGWKPGRGFDDFRCAPSRYKIPGHRIEALIRDCVVDVLNQCGLSVEAIP